MTTSASITRGFLSGIAILGLLACGGSGSSSSGGSGSMNVHLVDGPIAGYQHINVDIQQVQINGPNGWMTLSSPNQTYDLLSLTNGLSATLAKGATLPAGHYEQMRLVLGSGNTVVLSSGTTQPLTTPSALQSGLKLIVSFDVAAGTTADVFIDFDAAHSIQITQTGASNKYILRPTIRAFDKTATGSVSGKLTDGSNTAIAGAQVYAETLDGSGSPTIVRSAITASDGTYTLDLLPLGGTYFAVSQPITATASYNALASAGFAISSASPTFTWNASFTQALSTGTVGGSYATAATADQSDTVDLIQTLPEGGTAASAKFAIHSQIATVTSTGETYKFTSVPTGDYSVRSTRTTLNADGSTTVSAPVTASATVTANATITVNF
ncbi:MAG TPA: DUF4382 domain-containing protein [Holophagaceae bacterium]|jgi:hypothetical protein|nr:DUF4382 domain-containing protein [Holophagaceae bacterium]